VRDILIFDPATLRQGAMGSITGVIYYDFGAGRQFPEAGWNDFVVVILNWWIEALQQVTAGSEPVRFCFMDGPYRMTAVLQSDDSLLLSCIEDRREVEVLFDVLVDVRDLRRELTAVAQRVSRACASAGIESSDLNELRTHLRRLVLHAVPDLKR
jgi:hypothetical protein